MFDEKLDKKKIYFVTAIVLLILLGVVLIIHFSNKSMVNIDNDKTTTKKVTTTISTSTTTTNTTTKRRTTNTTTTSKVVVNEVKDIHKSAIDDNNGIVYSYKLTEEINEYDKIISNKMDISEGYKNNNIIRLYDISLYNSDLIKKNVSNSLITISIPIDESIKGYEEYKIVYIDNVGNISSEVFETNIKNDYIEFVTNHLSVYGVIGIKNEEVFNMDDVNIKLFHNNNEIINNDIVLSSINDSISVNVLNLDKEYKVYYALKNDIQVSNYIELLDGNVFNGVNTPNMFTLLIKVVSEDKEKVFEKNIFKIYDIVYKYDKNEIVDEEVNIGKSIDNEYDYLDKEKNNNIVIDQVVSEATNADNSIIVKVSGNIYLVKETDISELELNGYLFVDTKDNITFNVIDNKIDISNLKEINIINSNFSLNGIDYSYSIVEDNLVIKKIVDNIETNVLDFEDIFNNSNIETRDGSLIIKPSI